MNEAQQERMEAAYQPEGSLIAVLLEQHARIRELFAVVKGARGDFKQRSFDELRQLLAVHEAGEEMILRPVSRKISGPEIARARDHEESDAAHVLADLEKLDVDSAEFDQKLAGLELDVSDHADREEDEEFPPVLAECTEEELTRLGELLAKAEKAAPNHPHPVTTGSSAAQWTVGPFAGLLDRARDAFKS
jgi:hemerythrin superfamily protein